MDLVEKESEEDERRLKNLATRIMSNGVEVLVKDKNPDGKQEQVKRCFLLFRFVIYLFSNTRVITC